MERHKRLFLPIRVAGHLFDVKTGSLPSAYLHPVVTRTIQDEGLYGRRLGPVTNVPRGKLRAGQVVVEQTIDFIKCSTLLGSP